MRNARVLRTAAAVLLLVAAAPAQSFDELLPDSTFFYLSMEDLGRTKERFDQSPLKALWQDEETQAFVAKAMKRWDEWMEETRKEDGFSPSDVFRTVSGQVVLALPRFLPKGEGDPEPVMVVLADVGDKAEEVRRMVAAAERAAEEKGERFRREEEEFRGATLVHYRRAASDEDSGEDGGPDCWFLAGPLFGAADDPEDLKAILARRGAGAEGSLAGKEAYRRIRDRLGGRADIVAYVDGTALFETFAKTMDAEVATVLGAMGVASIEAAGLQIALEPASLTMRMFLSVRGRKQGVLKLIDGANSAALPPRFVPADVTSAATYTLSLMELWNEARRVGEKVQPGMAAQMDGFMEMIKAQMGVDLRADVFGALGEQIVYYVRLPDKPGEAVPPPFGAGPGLAGMPAFVIAWSVKDKARLEGALQAVYAQAGPMLQEGEFLGTKYRVLNMQPMIPVQPALALLPDQLVVALSLDDLKDVLTRYGKDVKGLVDEPDFARALEHLPPERFALGFSRDAKAFRQGFMMGFMAGVQGAEQDVLDMELFPKVETLEKYLDASGTAMVNEEDGLTYVYRLGLKKKAD